MASNTEHLNLLKKDPLTDGSETFNIQTMLNDNWDKIDEAVGSLQDEIANLDPDIPEGSTSQKGIVQLSSAINSTSEALAATPKAVKVAYELANSGMVPRTTTATDFNNITTPGVYAIPAPENLSNNFGFAGWGLLEVTVTGAGPYIHQRFFCIGNSGGRIFERARSEAAASWTAWKEIALVGSVQGPLTNQRAIELGLNVSGAGSAYIDFHSGATVADFDSRIIADGGNGSNQGGNLNLHATNIWLNALTLADKLWVARNTAFGSTTAIDLAIGDSDTGFDWVTDGQIDFYSNNQVPARLINADFQFKNTTGGFESLKQAVAEVRQGVAEAKQSGVDAKNLIVGAANSKGAGASTADSWQTIANKISGIVQGGISAVYSYSAGSVLGTGWERYIVQGNGYWDSAATSTYFNVRTGGENRAYMITATPVNLTPYSTMIVDFGDSYNGGTRTVGFVTTKDFNISPGNGARMFENESNRVQRVGVPDGTYYIIIAYYDYASRNNSLRVQDVSIF